MFAYDKPYTQLNFPHEGGVTAYFSPNFTQEELKLVQDFLKDQQIDPLNTRSFKYPDATIEISVGSIESGSKEVEYQGRKFVVTKGEFAPYLEECIYYLEKALPYCANDN